MKTPIKDIMIPVGSGTTQVGIPFGRSWHLPTAQNFKNAGDIMLAAALAIPMLGEVITIPAVVIKAGTILLILGKFLTKCFSNIPESEKTIQKAKIEEVKTQEVNKEVATEKIKELKK